MKRWAIIWIFYWHFYTVWIILFFRFNNIWTNLIFGNLSGLSDTTYLSKTNLFWLYNQIKAILAILHKYEKKFSNNLFCKKNSVFRAQALCLMLRRPFREKFYDFFKQNIFQNKICFPSSCFILQVQFFTLLYLYDLYYIRVLPSFSKKIYSFIIYSQKWLI